MRWLDLSPLIAAPGLSGVHLWLLAGLSFGFGDAVTTIVGLRVTGVYEMHPIAAYLFQYSTLGTIIVLKTIVFGICYVLWKRTPRPHRLGVPLGLITVGVPVTAWNLHVLLQTVFL